MGLHRPAVRRHDAIRVCCTDDEVCGESGQRDGTSSPAAVSWVVDTTDSKCNDGFMDDDFAFAEKNGPCTEASYSYPFTTQMECSSPFMRGRNSCEDQLCVTGDRFVAGFAHQVTADAGAEVKAFNAYAKWCSDQAQVDGRRQKTIDASIASTNAAIEKFGGNSRSRHCFHKCRHRENCRQGRKCHRGHLFSYKLDHIGGLGVDRSECRERKRWRRTSAN